MPCLERPVSVCQALFVEIELSKQGVLLASGNADLWTITSYCSMPAVGEDRALRQLIDCEAFFGSQCWDPGLIHKAVRNHAERVGSSAFRLVGVGP
jgi:hypothetical protein